MWLLVEQNARVTLKTTDRASVIKEGGVKREAKASDVIFDPQIIHAYLGSRAPIIAVASGRRPPQQHRSLAIL